MWQWLMKNLSRRALLKAGMLSAAGVAGSAALAKWRGRVLAADAVQSGHDQTLHERMGAVGAVDHAQNGFDPHAMLSDFDYGQVSRLDSGQVLREFSVVAVDRQIEVAPGVYFPAWTYNGRVPGPCLRCVEGDRVRIHFVNAGSHPHTMHFHGIHAAAMDGVPGVGAGMIPPGGSTVYEFDAFPFGCHLYHCHAVPLKRHIHKGLYGAFIVDPDPAKYQGAEHEAAKGRNHLYPESGLFQEMVMVMNAFDTNLDGENEIYAANTVAFAYMNQPIPVRRSQRQRVYLVNVTEFDPLNSFHLHGNFFDYYDHGTTLTPTLKTVDTIMQCQAQRGILEFSFENFEPGLYMFHAHQSEFAELGWMGFFQVRDDE